MEAAEATGTATEESPGVMGLAAAVMSGRVEVDDLADIKDSEEAVEAKEPGGSLEDASSNGRLASMLDPTDSLITPGCWSNSARRC
mmetsp:Transcript_29758/g.58278  ORF Transcript_29758/g.58278 Transcript_29758/m.58278 type:complete len:86 (+) Transcript_29758:706-963(+)